MLFPTPLFLLGFLPAAVAVYWLLPAAGGWRRAWLLFASAVFYGAASPRWLLLLAGLTVVTHVGTRYLMGLVDPRWRRTGLALVLGNLVVLGVFKYYDALASTRGGPLLRLVLPVGLSFYTFNLIGYGLDVYRRRTAPAESLFDLATYVSFFPTLTAGPLMRWSDFRGQIDGARGTSVDVERAVFTLTIGLAKKLLVADWLARVSDPLWAAPVPGLWTSWAALVGYHFRIYFDFSGYSDIAIATGLLLGVRVPVNFKAPYAARSPAEFWRRWHVTLSEWFRDYLFFPMSRGLLRRGGSRHPDLTRTASLVATMTLVGLWHGPTAGMVLWGAYHGLLLAGHAQLVSPLRKAWPTPVARVGTTLAVLMGWVLFRSESLAAAGGFYAALLGAKGLGPAVLPGRTLAFVLVVVVLAVVTAIPRDTADSTPPRTRLYATALAALLLLALMGLQAPTPFVYFQF